MSEVYDLNKAVQEYFSFSIGGFIYRYRHMTTEEIEKLKSFEGSEDKKQEEYMYSFITKEDPKAPDFPEVAKKMIVPQWINFRKMINTEFGV